jgi:hypothetical protein
MANPASLVPFKKGYDPRRNLRGVPKEAIAARKFFRKVGAELLRIKEKQDNGEVTEYDITRLEAMVRLKFSSKAPADFQTILKVLYPGLLKDELDVTTGGEKIGANDSDTRAEILRKLDSIATATGAGSVAVQPDPDPSGNTGT